MPLTPLICRYDHVLLDLDGCVWVGEEAIDGAPEAVSALREGGKRVAFVTNDVRHSGEEFVRKLWRLGFQASLEEVVTVAGALQHRLSLREGGSAYVVGGPNAIRHVEDAGMRVVNGTEFATRADIVVVAGDETFEYDALRTAVQAVLRGADLLGAHRDRTFPMPDGPWPGSGSILAAVEYATGRTAETVGKPEAQIFLTALDRLGEGRALVIGDRLDADIAGARAAGLDGAIVLSGVTSREEGESPEGPQPVAMGATLADLVLA